MEGGAELHTVAALAGCGGLLDAPLGQMRAALETLVMRFAGSTLEGGGVSSTRYQRHGDPSRASARPGWWRGSDWEHRRFGQPGWVLLPLRVFLGVTFTYASLQKLSNPDFFDPGSPVSVQHQMQTLAPTSPIGPLVQLSTHAGVLVGLAIALGELAVGLGTLMGLRARLAAVGGAVLALSFFLTVSWSTRPYYYGADIVFLFAWTPLIAAGAGGVLSP